MLPTEPHLEVRSCLPARNGNGRRPPLLFVHGGYFDAWCWTPYFLPWFAEKGFASYALSLRGHGKSAGREMLFVAGLDDYAADVEHVVAGLSASPVLIGHSMGAAVVERLMATRPVRAAALLSAIAPAGLLPMAARLATEQTDDLLTLLQFDPMRLTTHVLDTLQPFYFSDDMAPEILAEAPAHLCLESPRVLLDLSLRLHWQLPERGEFPVFVMGAEGDRISTVDDTRATARHHGVEPTIVPESGHMMMLERKWKAPAQALLGWLQRI